MSKENKGNGGGEVVGMTKCRAEKCSKKDKKLGFCDEHYTWFKEGLITREGAYPSDFDKKYQAFCHRTGKKAA